MIRFGMSLLGAALLLAAAGCGTARPHRVPDVLHERLDLAEDTLETAGLRYRASGGGAFGIVVRSHWVVYRQLPRAGTVATTVTLYVERACDSDTWDD